MMQLITPEHYGDFVHDLAEMHRLLCRVFKQRLDWSVEISGDMEIDEFDVLRPVHLLNRSPAGRIQGCVRLLPSTGSTMLRDAFSVLLDGQPAPRSLRSGRAADLGSIFLATRRKRVADLLPPPTNSLRA
ncbi:N-acyl-L-homoserine lactone synthetase [Bradyrhizobium sp. i1.15.2]